NGMIESRVRICTSGRKGVRGWIIKICVETRRRSVLIIERTASGQNSAIRQNRRAHLDARLGHIRSPAPRRSARPEVDEFSRRSGGIAAAHDEDARIIIITGHEGK